MDTDAGSLPSALRRVVRHPAHLMLPAAVLAAAGGLAGVAHTVVHAWTAPTLLEDGAFTFGAGSTAATVATAVAAALLAVAVTATVALLGLLTAAHELGRTTSVRSALREVARRWGLVLTWSALLAAVGALTGVALVAALAALPDGVGAAVVVVVLLVAAAASALVGRVLPVAVLQGVGGLAAWRLLRMQRRNAFAARCYANTVLLTVATAVLGGGLVWLAGRLPEAWGHPALDATESFARAVASTLAVAVVAVGTALAHVRATQRTASLGDTEPVWPGLDRAAAPQAVTVDVAQVTPDDDVAPPDDVAGPAAHPADLAATAEAAEAAEAVGTERPAFWSEKWEAPSREATRRRRTAWLRSPWVTAIPVWALAPAALVAVVTTNPTPAVEPVVHPIRATLVNPFTVAADDGVAVVSYERITTCTAEGGCETDHPFIDFDHSAVAGLGGGAIAITGEDRADGAAREYVLLTCDAGHCDPYGDEVTRAHLAGDEVTSSQDALAALATRDGAYAAVYASGEYDDLDLTLTLCADERCDRPETVALGSAHSFDVVRAAFAPDGTLWVLQSTAEDDVAHLRAIAPGATSPVDALTLDVPTGEYGYLYSPGDGYYQRPPVFELAVRDDGTPVVVYRDTSDGAFTLVSCDDAACASSTSTRLPFDPVTTWSAQLAVDSTGRPLIASAGDDVRIHSCADRACTSMRTGLVADAFPEALGAAVGGAPFMVLDAEERPVFLVSPAHAYDEVRFCTERRCGL